MSNHADAPKRSTFAFTVNLGMLPVKVRLFSPTEDNEAIKTHQYFEAEVKDDQGNITVEDHEVGIRPYDKVTGLNVDKADIVNKAKVGDELVALTPEEKALVTAGSAVDKGDVPVEGFVPLDQIGSRYHVKSSYQIRPALRQEKKKSVRDPQAEKAFVLFMEAMKAKGVGCLVRLGMRTTARYGIITPDGRMHMLYFDSEVREDFEWPEVEVSDAHVDAACGLIDGYGVDTPDLVDESAAALEAYLKDKANGGEIIEAPAVSESDDEPDLDFTALLEASISVVKSAKAKANA